MVTIGWNRSSSSTDTHRTLQAQRVTLIDKGSLVDHYTHQPNDDVWNIEYNTGSIGGPRRNATVATDERCSGPSGTVDGWMTSGQIKEEIISQPHNMTTRNNRRPDLQRDRANRKRSIQRGLSHAPWRQPLKMICCCGPVVALWAMMLLFPF